MLIYYSLAVRNKCSVPSERNCHQILLSLKQMSLLSLTEICYCIRVEFITHLPAYYSTKSSVRVGSILNFALCKKGIDVNLGSRCI